MPDYTPLGIYFPLDTDRVKDSTSTAKLAEDIGKTATTADAAITAAKTQAIADATTKYGGLPANVAALDDSTTPLDLIVNGSFRDGLNGWGTVGAWLPQDNGITSWARATSGADRTLKQLVTVPAYLGGKVLRLSVRAWSTSTGSLSMYATPITGIISIEHTLTLDDATYALSVPVPETQGSDPIVIDIGRSNGSVYMTAIRFEAA